MRSYTILVNFVYSGQQCGRKYRRRCPNPMYVGMDTPYRIPVNILHPMVARLPRIGPSFPSTYKKEPVN